MATPNAQQGSPVGAALVLTNKNILGIVTPQGLERPVSSLAENVQRVMGSFYDVHRALIVRKGSLKGPGGIEQFKESKHLFRTECESLRQVLQSGYRHAVDFASSCQRAPNDRHVSAKRCQLSGKGVLRDLHEVNRVYDRNLEKFRSQEADLKNHLAQKSKKGQSRSSSVDEHQDPKDAHPEVAVSALFLALQDVQSSLRDILAFWDNHTTFLTLVVNRQSNFPVPGDETKSTVEIWIRYQAALLQASSSISQSADAMTVDPSVVIMNGKARRRHTFPQGRVDEKPPMADRRSYQSGYGKETGGKSSAPSNGWWKRLFMRIFHTK